MKKTLLIMLLAPLFISACGEFAYKSGASAKDLELTKKNCESVAGNNKNIDQCMKDNGWVVQKLDDLDPFATASVNTDNRNISPKKSMEIDSSNDKNVVIDGNAYAASPTQITVTPADPLDKFIVSSWWKIGGGADGMQTAINECVSRLGEAHRPNPATNETTRGLGICMRDLGWRGLKVQK